MKDNNKTKKLTNVLFMIYLIALFWIIIFKFNVRLPSLRNMRNINLIPFSEPLMLNGKIAFGEMIMNVVIFVPLGIYAGILFKRWSTLKKLFLFFLISLICEVLQYILNIGASDITDIINNTLGGLIGLIIYKGIGKAFKNSVKSQKFINIIALTGTILMISILFLLKINKLWIFRMES
ncbi:VanZ family protein [Clostridium gelidum]|uniref:VanZ family protein n=1 Tax=Clostridium gelidum TaxID=704125 RepID=A0ABN6IUR4_9CLOT|nr:VanZ family protein [Clostridium gelidum]BCZ45747.1 VanZ family protein [Clostridium gelidum]